VSAPPGSEIGPDGAVTADLALTNGRLVTPDGVVTGGLEITAGRISRLLGVDAPARAVRTVDVRGRYVMPGVIDSHVHFRVPGLSHKEDWTHGSRAAAAGGVTTVIDMPNTQPAFLDPRTVADRAGLIEGTSLVDFCFHLGVDGGRLELLDHVESGAVAGLKVFMAGHHTAPHVIREPELLAAVFARAAELGLRVSLHAEDQATFDLLDEWRGAGRHRLNADLARPRSGGIVAVARVIELTRRHGTAAHVLHVSSAEEVDLLTAAARELPITFEVTGHHLTFTRADARGGAWRNLSPALRTARDRERLWRAVRRAEVTTIGSDHSPHTRAEKLAPPGLAPPGMPGVQELLAAVHTGLARRWGRDPDWRMGRIAQLLAARPAELFGLAERKGRLAPGLDADVVVFDPDVTWSPTGDSIWSRCGWSPHEARPLTGMAVLTVRRGEVIWDAAGRRFGRPTGRWTPAGVRRGPRPSTEPASAAR
jgi:dihydroorotase